jgi:Protein of unknown function (DUF2950)
MTAMKSRSIQSLKMEAPLVVPALLLAILFAVLSFPTKSPAQTTDSTWQAVYATPTEAGKALLAANRANDLKALTEIFGPESEDIFNSGDPVEDQAARQSFVAKYQKMNRWVPMSDGSLVLYIGADNYAFPVPLVQGADLQWYFDSDLGEDEIVARRVGRNELLAMDACAAIAEAQKAYFDTGHDGNPEHQYASKIISSPDKQDGLYWPATSKTTTSPLNGLDDIATTSAANGNAPILNGYRFRIFSPQEAAGGSKTNSEVDGKLTGGFAVIASPVRYGESGVMTFLLSSDGALYQRDLGDGTNDIAASIKSYNADEGWALAE